MKTSYFAQHWPSRFQSNKFLIFLFAITIMLLASVSSAIGAQVTLAWDANNPAPQGYKVFQRIEGTAYDYDHPAWPTDGSDHLQTTCTITNLTAGVTYYFVVRAYLGNDLSGDSNEITYTVPAAVTLSSITISGPTQLNENSSAQYACTAHYSDGSTAALSSGVAWSENSTATSINASGLLTAANVTADTTVTITASYGGRSDTHGVTVKYVAPTLSSITISGPTQLNENSSAQYACTAHYSDGSTAVLSSGVAWSENSAATSINASGLLTAANVTADTTVTITASYGGRSDTHGVTVKYVAPTLSSITISGPTQLNENSSAQYACTAHYSDGSTAALSSGVAWSENGAATSINASGLLTAANVTADTTVTITASYGGISDTHSVTVKYVAPTLSSITISGPTQLNENSSAQYACTAHYSDGSTAALSSGVAWSENGAATSINASGLLTAANVTADTTVTITASYGGRSDTHGVTVKYVAPTLSSITISGPTQLNENSSAQYACTAHYSDNTTSIVTDKVNWSVNSSFANIDAAGYLVTHAVQNEEQLTITASVDGKHADYGVTVNNSNITHTLTIDILGSGAVLLNPPGGIYDDGTVVTLTAEPDHAWAFDGWAGSVFDPDTNITSVVMDTDISLSVTFLEDTDLDSVPDQEEWGIDGQNNTFDGNGDGIADYLQSNVASIHTKDYLHFLTLSTPEPGKITSCKMNDTASIASVPSECSLPLGLISFKIENLTPGANTTLTINMPTGSEFDTFYKYGATFDNPATHWYEFMYDQTSETGAVLEGDTITLYLKDGQRGDDDLSANGVISDPGGPGILEVDENTIPTPPNHQTGGGDTTSSGSIGSGCFIDSISNASLLRTFITHGRSLFRKMDEPSRH